jgi:thiol-disulfide isomerase/thioredoxin
MKHFALSLFAFIASFLSSYAEIDSVCIEVSVPQCPGREIFLCAYFKGSVYKQDSIFLSPQGKGIFHKNETYPEGQYLIYLKNNLFVDLLLAGDQTFSIAVDTSDLINRTQINGAPQTEAFLAYSQFLNGKQRERQKIIDDLKALPEDKQDLADAEARLGVLNREVQDYRSKLQAKFKDKWICLFLNGVEPVTTGPFPFPKTQEEYDAEFYYQKYHYFDNINLKDKRFWWTRFFPKKVIDYMEKQVEQHPDSLAYAASRLAGKTLGDSICFRLMINTLIDYSSSSAIMGMENIWMKLVEDYYQKSLVAWGDSAHYANIEFEYAKRRYNRIGMIARNLELTDANGKSFKLYDLGKKYTLLYFFEPTCGHCIETTPKVYETIYKKYAEKGLDVVAVDVYINKEEWLKFIEDHRLEGEHWHNLWDPDRKSAYFRYYDTSSTPSVYLLDENKKIIAKKIDADSMDLILGQLLN